MGLSTLGVTQRGPQWGPRWALPISARLFADPRDR